MLFKTDDDAERIAANLVEAVKAELLPEKQHEAGIGTALTEVFCRAMLQVFPEPSQVTGKDILDTVSEINAIGTFPDPRRDAMKMIARMSDSSKEVS